MGKEYRFDAVIQKNPDMDAAYIIFPMTTIEIVELLQRRDR